MLVNRVNFVRNSEFRILKIFIYPRHCTEKAHMTLISEALWRELGPVYTAFGNVAQMFSLNHLSRRDVGPIAELPSFLPRSA